MKDTAVAAPDYCSKRVHRPRCSRHVDPPMACQQSMGLIARILEEVGILFVKFFVRGTTLGPTSDAETHQAVIRKALSVLTEATEPGAIIDSTRAWKQ